jgi:hypothetical protein
MTRRRGLLLSAVLLVAVAVALLAPHRPRTPPPSPEREGEAWDHAELLDYLRSRGLRFDATPDDCWPAHGPAQRWTAPGGVSSTSSDVRPPKNRGSAPRSPAD